MSSDVTFRGESFNMTAGAWGLSFKQDGKEECKVSAKFVLECLNMNKELHGKKLGCVAGIKQSWHVNHLLKKAGKGKLSEQDKAELTKIGTKVLAYVQAKGLTTQDGKGNMTLNKAACHKARDEKEFRRDLEKQLKPLLEIKNSIINENGYGTILSVSMRTDLTDWNRLEEGTQLRGDYQTVLNKVSDLPLNYDNLDSLGKQIAHARELCDKLVKELEVLESKLPEGDSDKAKLSKIKDSFIQIKNQLKEIDEQYFGNDNDARDDS